MFSPSRALKIWLYRRPVDMRKSFDGLSALAQATLAEDPLSGAVFVFVNRRRTHMKCLYFDSDGYCIWAKRLEQGRFQVRFDADSKVALDAVALRWLIDGIGVSSAQRFKRYAHPQMDVHPVQ
jgi:transposase